MKVRSLFLVVALLLAYLETNAQSLTDTIYWRSDYKLTWDDFQGEPKLNSHTAVSSVNFLLNYKFSDTGIIFFVKSVFYKKKSWVNKQIADLSVLNHEQTHFNINEVLARELLLSLQNANLNKITTTNIDIQKIYDSVGYLWNSITKRYDTETDYSRNDSMQKVWDKKIMLQLNELPPLK